MAKRGRQERGSASARRYLLDFAQEELLGESSARRTSAQQAPARGESHQSAGGTRRYRPAQEEGRDTHAARRGHPSAHKS